KKKEKTFNWGIGKDAYFKMNLRRFKISKGSRTLWESELYGFGIQCYTFYDRYLINDWWLNVSCYLNLGLNQTFITSSTNNNSAQEVWAFRLGANQLLNLGLKKRFNYQCSSCGFSGRQLHWRCPSCKGWDQMERVKGIEAD
ncbi:MAG: hypothetical protein P8J42_06680, partial [Pseudomonadales bacterium]|nr:hypothetical protein [Pseudomonadales bacterium]